jgi:hypothetical protein
MGESDISETVKAEKTLIIKEGEGNFEVEGYPQIRFSFSY